jgi:hypothetical protein
MHSPATLVRALALAFVAIVLAVHVVRRDVSPLGRGISRYASGRTLAWTTVAFVALAAALGIVAWTTASWMLAVAAMAMAGVAARPDRTTAPAHDVVHTAFGFIFFLSAAAGIYTSPHSSPWPAVATAIFFLALARVPVLRRTPGLWQRLCFLTIVIWLLSPFMSRS